MKRANKILLTIFFGTLLIGVSIFLKDNPLFQSPETITTEKVVIPSIEVMKLEPKAESKTGENIFVLPASKEEKEIVIVEVEEPAPVLEDVVQDNSVPKEPFFAIEDPVIANNTQITEVPPPIVIPVLSASESTPRCVYNEAYQENYDSDTVEGILANANGCYVLVDLFGDVSVNDIAAIKKHTNVVGCYISVGTGEDWRDDFKELTPFLAADSWDEWEGEYFISEITSKVIKVMRDRIDVMAAQGCDYVEFDNMDWGADDDYVDEYNLDVDSSGAEAYAQDLCEYTHERGMLCMAKSTTYGLDLFDGVTYESYSDEKDWWDASELQDTLSSDKLGIVVHYDERDCGEVHDWYIKKYGEKLSFVCESQLKQSYEHF